MSAFDPLRTLELVDFPQDYRAARNVTEQVWSRVRRANVAWVENVGPSAPPQRKLASHVTARERAGDLRY